MFEEIEERYGYLDILVNNSASGQADPGLRRSTRTPSARALDTNLKGSFWCARAAAPLMARRGGGCIVNVSSIGAGFVPANYVVVGTSKAALEALTRYLAVEFAPLNIRVNTASCTLIEGDVARAFPDSEEVVAVTIASTPLGRLATADDLAGVIMFLASDSSRFITGQTVLADGGLSLGSVMMSARRDEAARCRRRACRRRGAGRCPPSAPARQSGTEVPLSSRRRWLAIVGMGLVVPGANSPDEFWKVLVDGPELFRRVPEDRWDYRSFYSRGHHRRGQDLLGGLGLHHRLLAGRRADRRAAGRATDGDDSTALWLRHALLQALERRQPPDGDRYSFVVGYTADGSAAPGRVAGDRGHGGPPRGRR